MSKRMLTAKPHSENHQITNSVVQHFKKAKLSEQYMLNREQSSGIKGNGNNICQEKQIIRTLPPNNIIPMQKVQVRSSQNLNTILAGRGIQSLNTVDGVQYDPTEVLFDSNVTVSDHYIYEPDSYLDEALDKSEILCDNCPEGEETEVVNEEPNATEECNCCGRCKKNNLLILTKLTNIEDILEKNLLLKKRTRHEFLPNMPFSDINELKAFDESLKQTDINRAFTDKLSSLGGSTLLKSVSNIMETIVTNESSKNISWSGANNTLQFSSLKMRQIIVHVIQMLDGANKKDDMQKRIAEWLRRCGDRIKSERKKVEKGNAVNPG